MAMTLPECVLALAIMASVLAILMSLFASQDLHVRQEKDTRQMEQEVAALVDGLSEDAPVHGTVTGTEWVYEIQEDVLDDDAQGQLLRQKLTLTHPQRSQKYTFYTIRRDYA